MSHQDDPIFETTHSLPVLSHSLAIATRSPTMAQNQETKYMPDYGGILETPNSYLKNNALAKGFPFYPKSSFTKLISDKQEVYMTTTDCLAVVSHYNTGQEFQFSTVRALNKDLIFDLIEDGIDETSDEELFIAASFAQISHSSKIMGIKLSPCLQEFLLVRYGNKVKTWKFDTSYQISNIDRSELSKEQTPLKSLSTVSERSGFHIKDACINHFNKTIQGVASDNQDLYQVKLYDLAVSSTQPFQTIAWHANEPEQNDENELPLINRQLRGRTVAKYISSNPAPRGIQQLDNVPSHLVNMLVTTDYRTALIDPRQDRLGQIYVDKTENPSFYPIEFLRRIEFSPRNCYQFYSLSNVNIRVLDTRYPGLPVNQVSHMLDSFAYKSMNMKVIEYPGNNLETLCLASTNRLCFSTFDQSRNGSLINPRSTHLPYHEPAEDEIEKLYGLGLTTNLRENGLFAILQLSENGDICIRKYPPHPEDLNIEANHESRVEKIVNKADESINSTLLLPVSEDIMELDALISEPSSDIEPINILDVTTDLEEMINSQRALDRFEKMRNKLDKI